MFYVPSGSLESTMLGASFLKFLKLYLFGKYMYMYCFRPKKVIFKTIAEAEIGWNSTCTCTVHVLSKQIQFQNFQERCAQHGAFQRTTRIIKHRTPSYIGTQKTRDFFKRWCKRAKIESKNHDNVVNLVLYWTFLGLLALYEVVERLCAIFYILMYFDLQVCWQFFWWDKFCQIGVADPWNSWKTPL